MGCTSVPRSPASGRMSVRGVKASGPSESQREENATCDFREVEGFARLAQVQRQLTGECSNASELWVGERQGSTTSFSRNLRKSP